MSETQFIDDVIQSESDDIATRRQIEKLPKVDKSNGLVGLSLSGGGLRSACFSMGVVQALHASGLWKLIDYVSSVSGGGYTAGYVSNQLAQAEKPLEHDEFPLTTETTESDEDAACGPQSRHVRRLIHSGNYLFRPGFFANRYLFGLVLINVAAFSLVVAIAALVAFLWRCLDYEFVRRNADLVGLDDDLLIPFVPAGICAVLWITAWVLSVWRRNDLSTGRLARCFLYAMIPAVLIGVSLVAGNGDNQGSGVQRLTGSATFVMPNSVWATITGVIGAALLPWIRPQRILQSGINPQSSMERFVFYLASTGMLIGVPLLLVGFFAQENISGFNSHPYRAVVGGDIKNANVVASMVMEPPKQSIKQDAGKPNTTTWEVGDFGKTNRSLNRNRAIPQAVYLPQANPRSDNSSENSSNGSSSGPNSANRQSDDSETDATGVRTLFQKTLVELAKKRTPDTNNISDVLQSTYSPNDLETIEAVLRNGFFPIAAHPHSASPSQQGVRTFLLQKHNGSDDDDRPDEIASAMLFETADSIEEILFAKQNNPLDKATVLAAIASIDLNFLASLRSESERASYSFIRTDSLGQVGPTPSDGAKAKLAMIRALLCSVHATHLIQPFITSARLELKDNQRFHDSRLLPNVKTWYANFGHWTGLGKGNNTSDYVQARQLSRQINDNMARSLEIALFDDNELRLELAENAIARAEENDASEKTLPPEVTSFLANAAISERINGTPEEGRRLSRLALQSVVPQSFRERTDIRRTISHEHDQTERLTICLVATGIFLIAGIFVNLNTVSLHRYYRNRIAQAFVSNHNGDESSLPLSEIDTCRVGGPYHLISGAISLWRNNFLQTQPVSSDWSDSEDTPIKRRLRSQDSFLMTKNFCGSDLTGYVKTQEYERMIPGSLNKIDLADAIAISGAAVSPGNVSNPLIAALMLILNLRLGQWLPNPNRTPSFFPNVLGSLIDTFRRWQNRQYFFVSDGGVNENLGLVQLLKRKCRLIVCVDASHDPQHQFADLARAVADVRVHDGIRFVEVDPDAQSESSAFTVSDLCVSRKDKGIDQPFCDSHFKVGRILYSDGSKGTLVFVKPTLTGDESIDLLHYRAKNKDFPHECTSDQFYEPTQVEAYRRLGEHIGKRIGRAIGLDLLHPESQESLVDAVAERLEDYQRENSCKSVHKIAGKKLTTKLHRELELWLRTRNWPEDTTPPRAWTSLRNGFRAQNDDALLAVLASFSKDTSIDPQVRIRAANLVGQSIEGTIESVSQKPDDTVKAR